MKKRKIVAFLAAGICGVSALVGFSGCTSFLNPADYEQWSTNIASKTMLSAVLVEKINYATGEKGMGSGMIFYESDTHYYALTNNHVVHKSVGEVSVGYEAIDCYDNAYMSAKVEYAAADYDLAVVSFQKKGDVDLEVTGLAWKNATTLQQIALISNPKGRHNATTFGRVSRYDKIELGNSSVAESNVTFSVMAHDCFSLDGSSGGAIINESLEIVAVHYACGYAEDGSFVEGYAVPVEKVREFLVTAETVTGKELGV